MTYDRLRLWRRIVIAVLATIGISSLAIGAQSMGPPAVVSIVNANDGGGSASNPLYVAGTVTSSSHVSLDIPVDGGGSVSNPVRVDPTGTTTQPVSGTVSVSGPVSITVSPDAGGSAGNPLRMDPTGTTTQPVSVTGTGSSVVSEVLVKTTPDAGAMPVPASALAGRKVLMICNYGPNAIWCRPDGTEPTVGVGVRIGPLTEAPGNCLSADCDGTSCPWKCVAATATQVTGAATVTLEYK